MASAYARRELQSSSPGHEIAPAWASGMEAPIKAEQMIASDDVPNLILRLHPKARPVSQAAAPLAVASSLRNLPRFQRSLRADGSSRIPDEAFGGGGSGFRAFSG